MKRFLTLVLAFMLVPLAAQADIGPKPTLAIALPAALAKQVAEGELLLCQQADCADAKPLESLGPQHFFCAAEGCSGMAYGFAPFLQLRLKLRDGSILTSGVFRKNAYAAQFFATYDSGMLSLSER